MMSDEEFKKALEGYKTRPTFEELVKTESKILPAKLIELERRREKVSSSWQNECEKV